MADYSSRTTFMEEEEDAGEDGEMVDLLAHMMDDLFLHAKIKGSTQSRYLTLSEAKVEAMRRSELNQSHHLDSHFSCGMWDKLVEDIETYDENSNVIVVVQVNIEEAPSSEPTWNYFVHG